MNIFANYPLRKKFPNSEIFMTYIFHIQSEIGEIRA